MSFQVSQETPQQRTPVNQFLVFVCKHRACLTQQTVEDKKRNREKYRQSAEDSSKPPLVLTQRRPEQAPPGLGNQSSSEEETSQPASQESRNMWQGEQEAEHEACSLPEKKPSVTDRSLSQGAHCRDLSLRNHHRPHCLAHLVVPKHGRLSDCLFFPKQLKYRREGDLWEGLTPLLEQTCFEKLLPSSLKAFLGPADSRGTRTAPNCFQPLTLMFICKA